MDSKSYRLREFINQADGRSLVVDASGGLALGALPGFELITSALEPFLPLIDGLVTSPGQAPRFIDLIRRSDAAEVPCRLSVPLLVRTDWTNAIRPKDFILPPETIHRVLLLEPSQGLQLGASALVLNFLLGYEETIEAGCLKDAVQLAIQGSQIGIPLIIDVQPLGPRIVLRNQAIALGVSYALEAGADGVVVPWVGLETLRVILAMAAGSPVWVKPVSVEVNLRNNTEENIQYYVETLSLGVTGLWLDENIFAMPDPVGTIQALVGIVHQGLHKLAQAGQDRGG